VSRESSRYTDTNGPDTVVNVRKRSVFIMFHNGVFARPTAALGLLQFDETLECLTAQRRGDSCGHAVAASMISGSVTS
jgi:hypothetical protein